jgi:hypothetical protein
MEKSHQLIALYSKVCQVYNKDLSHFVQRFSHNGHQGYITDSELLTIYLFSVQAEKKTEKKAMYQYIKDYWASWFPALPSYTAFCKRLNRLVDAFPIFINLLIEGKDFEPDLVPVLVGDACPIQTCAGNRVAKVAPNLVNKTYCATKDKWYYGVKLHLLAQKMPQTLPFPQFMGITPAACADLPVMKPVLEKLQNTTVVLDKAYVDTALAKQMLQNNCLLMTPIKDKKGETEIEKQQSKAYKQAVATAVAKIRQPIESFFNWIHQKTDIQQANKVRSEIGLKLHIFGKFAAALVILTKC